MEHLTDDQCVLYRDRRLGVRDLIAVDAHLAECADCRRRLRILQGAVTTARVMARLGVTHLSYEEMEACVDGRATAAIRTRVESHSRGCPDCLRELNDLKAFQRQITSSATTVKRREAIPFRGSSVRERLPYWAAVAAAVFVLVGAGVWWRTTFFHGANGPVLLALNDGDSQLRFSPAGRLTNGEWSEAERAIMEDAWKRRALEPSARISGLLGKQSGQRSLGAASGFDLIYPVGLAVVTAQPTFLWQPLNGARHYVVEVFDPDFHRVASSPQVTVTRWTPVEALEAGKEYTWQVKASANVQAIAPGPAGPEARFEILPAANALELERAAGRHHNAHLLLGALFARAGVLDRAEEELSALAAANPNSPEVRRLLESVTALRRPQK